MRKVIVVCCIIAVVVCFFACGYKKEQNEYLRIHIRANSNLQIDQNIKYQIKDKVVEVMIPLLVECGTKSEAEVVVEKNFDLIEQTANNVLKSKGFEYTAKAKLTNERFPTRSYENLTLESGFYDALILELGEAKGDNWWCVVYPPLCFLQANPSGQNIVYKSKLLEIIKKIVG